MKNYVVSRKKYNIETKSSRCSSPFASYSLRNTVNQLSQTCCILSIFASFFSVQIHALTSMLQPFHYRLHNLYNLWQSIGSTRNLYSILAAFAFGLCFERWIRQSAKKRYNSPVLMIRSHLVFSSPTSRWSLENVTLKWTTFKQCY